MGDLHRDLGFPGEDSEGYIGWVLYVSAKYLKQEKDLNFVDLNAKPGQTGQSKKQQNHHWITTRYGHR